MTKPVLRVATLAAAALGLLLVGVPAEADTFKHKKTGRVLKGRLLGSVTKEGKTVLMVRTEKGDARFLPGAEWDVTRERPKLPEWPPVSYRGKPRSARWLERQYQQFKDKIAIIEGKYYDIGSAHLWISPISRYAAGDSPYRRVASLAVGDCARVSLTVHEVLGHEEMVGRLNEVFVGNDDKGELRVTVVARADAQSIRVKGVSTAKAFDGKSVACGPLVAVGTFRYVTDQGRHRTIVDCRPLPTDRAALTRGQFRQALRSGFRLGIWREMGRRVRAGRLPARQTGLRATSGNGRNPGRAYSWGRVPVE